MLSPFSCGRACVPSIWCAARFGLATHSFPNRVFSLRLPIRFCVYACVHVRMCVHMCVSVSYFPRLWLCTHLVCACSPTTSKISSQRMGKVLPVGHCVCKVSLAAATPERRERDTFIYVARTRTGRRDTGALKKSCRKARHASFASHTGKS